MIPPTPHNRKNFVDPSSHESTDAALLGEAHSTREKGPLKGLWRADSINDENIFYGSCYETEKKLSYILYNHDMSDDTTCTKWKICNKSDFFQHLRRLHNRMYCFRLGIYLIYTRILYKTLNTKHKPKMLTVTCN